MGHEGQPPTTSSCGGSGVISGKLYVFTGCTRSSSGGTSRVGRLHRYDQSTNNWTALKAAPTADYQPAVAVLGGKLYVAGGIDATGSASARLDVYNPGDQQLEHQGTDAHGSGGGRRGGGQTGST